MATENTAHMMQCTLLARPCSLDDLNSFNNIAMKWRDGRHKFDDMMMMNEMIYTIITVNYIVETEISYTYLVLNQSCRIRLMGVYEEDQGIIPHLNQRQYSLSQGTYGCQFQIQDQPSHYKVLYFILYFLHVKL